MLNSYFVTQRIMKQALVWQRRMISRSVSKNEDDDDDDGQDNEEEEDDCQKQTTKKNDRLLSLHRSKTVDTVVEVADVDGGDGSTTVSANVHSTKKATAKETVVASAKTTLHLLHKNHKNVAEKEEENGMGEVATCLICLEGMKAADLAHPVQCPSCTFNFCCRCIEAALSAQTKKDTKATSVVSLTCPNCRSDLSRTICDTVLLRKIDNHHDSSSSAAADEELLLFQKAMDVDATLVPEIAAARDREAQFWEKKESHHDGWGTPSANTTSRREDDGGGEDHEEWGLEVDIRTGAHESIKLPKTHQQQQSQLLLLQQQELWPFLQQKRADPTLLAGLDSAMSVQEQEQVTRHLVSGDATELALAAKLLARVADKVRAVSRTTSYTRTTMSKAVIQTSPSSCSSSRMEDEDDETHEQHPQHLHEQQTLLSTVYQLIEDGKKARSRYHNGNSSPRATAEANDKGVPYHNANWHTKTSTIKAAQHRLIERQLREQLAYLKRHPLPARMPKYYETSISLDRTTTTPNASQIVKCLPFRFCNDTWNGTVLDAFTKIYVTVRSSNKLVFRNTGKNYAVSPAVVTSTFVDRNYKVKKQPPSLRPDKNYCDEGVRNILGGGHHSYQYTNNSVMMSIDNGVRIDTEHPRVLIAAVVDPAAAGGPGVFPGDVVTHLNGTELRDATVDDLIARICSLCDTNHNNNSSSSSSSTATVVHLQFVFNADRAVAEALKMRAVATQKMF